MGHLQYDQTFGLLAAHALHGPVQARCLFRPAKGVVVLSLTVEWGVGMERQGPSYGEVVSTKDVRVQALLGRSNSPTSRSPEAVEWIMNVWITRCRTLLPVEGGGLYRVRQDPSQPT